MIALLSLVLTWPLVFAQNYQVENNEVVNLKPAQLDIKDSDSLSGISNKQNKSENDNRGICEFGKVLKLDIHNFHSKIDHGNFFIKFYSPSCIYCNMFRSTWQELAFDLKNETKVCIAEYDCRAEIKLCLDLSVRRVPTLILFKDGKNVKTYKGSKDLTELRNFVIQRRSSKDSKEISAGQKNFVNTSISLWLIYLILIFYLK